MNIDDFRRRFTESRLYDPIVLEGFSADAYAELSKSEKKRILDACAPLRTGVKRQGAHDRCPLSNEARDAKRYSRRLDLAVHLTRPSSFMSIWQHI